MNALAAAPVIAVVGGCGGAGASTLCALLASCGPAQDVWPVLVDLDPLGGGIDVVLGAESVEGARWSGLHSAGDRLDPDQLVEGLPRWEDVPFLACDLSAPPDPAAVASVLSSARDIGPVIVDVGRWPSPARAATLEVATAVVLVVPARVPAVAAAASQRLALDSSGDLGPWLLVVRDDGGDLAAGRVAAALQLELAATVGSDPGLVAGRDRGVDVGRIRRSTRSAAREVLGRCRDVPAEQPLAIAARLGRPRPSGESRGSRRRSATFKAEHRWSA